MGPGRTGETQDRGAWEDRRNAGPWGQMGPEKPPTTEIFLFVFSLGLFVLVTAFEDIYGGGLPIQPLPAP